MRTWSRTSSRVFDRTFDRAESGLPPVVPDPYFEYTTLLLPGNGTNGAQNNTFLDSSTNAFSITRNGNTTQGTFSPFSQTGWGNYFDGSGDYLTVADNAALQMGSGDFTIEYWWYPNNITSYQNPIDKGYTGTGALLLQTGNGDGRIIVYASGSAVVTSSTSVTVNAWNHMALVRSGTTLTLYQNGASVGSATNSTNFNNTTQLGIGATGAPVVGSFPVVGYLSNVRFVKGTAVYTSNFTPPTTPLTAISGTSLLTCQSNRFIDNSSNSFAITRNGDVSVQAFSPFNPTAAWSASTNGGSGYFDGSGDYLTLSGGTPLTFGTGDFTIEFWYYSNNSGVQQILYDARPAGTNGIYVTIFKSSSNVLELFVNNAVVISGSTAVNAASWNHVALSRSGTSTKLFLNGVQQGSTYTDSNNYLNGASRPAIGSDGATIGNLPLNGYLSDLRVLKGTAQYTAAFTPPTAPLTAITNTSLLLNFTNAGIYDATSKNDLETVGNAQISTTQSKFGGSSMYFDGTGDYLLSVPRQPLALGSGDWTVEAWVYLTAAPVEFTALFCSWNYYTSGYNGNFIGRVSTSNLWTSFNGQGDQIAINGTYSWTQNTWFHMAWVRFGNTITVYRDGVSIGSTTDSKNLSDSENGLLIGVNRTNGTIGGGSPTQYITGYVDDFRVTRGIARYTSNFTPPTTAFPLL